LTTAGPAAIEIRVPRQELLNWAKETGRLWSAKISRKDDHLPVDEFVLPTELLMKLEASGKLRLNYLK
jgi:hypothetical protein